MSEFACRSVRMTAHGVIRVRGKVCELHTFGARYLTVCTNLMRVHVAESMFDDVFVINV